MSGREAWRILLLLIRKSLLSPSSQSAYWTNWCDTEEVLRQTDCEPTLKILKLEGEKGTESAFDFWY